MKVFTKILLAALSINVLVAVFHGMETVQGEVSRRVPQDYPTIQAAVDAAKPGDTVFVSSGVYYEKPSGINMRLYIYKSVKLIGENMETTIIDGQGWGHVVIIEASNVVVSGFTVRNSGRSWSEAGIALDRSYSSKIFGNKIANNINGIGLLESSNNIMHSNIIENNNQDGIRLVYHSSNNLIYQNNFTNNSSGIDTIDQSSNNRIYHNNFLNLRFQAWTSSYDVWDDGYPSGGNYWSDYTGVDEKSGPNQDLFGSDGIGDTPYNIRFVSNKDRFPLMEPWNPPVEAATLVEPGALNLESAGRWVTANIELPEGYSPSDIDPETIRVNRTVPVDLMAPIQVGDFDNNGIPDLAVKFNRTQLALYIIDVIGLAQGKVTLTINGKLKDKTPIQGHYTIAVLAAKR